MFLTAAITAHTIYRVIAMENSVILQYITLKSMVDFM